MTLADLVHKVPADRWQALCDAAHREGLPDMRRIDQAVQRAAAGEPKQPGPSPVRAIPDHNTR